MNMDDKYFDIAELVSKYLANDLTDSERERLMEWVKLSEKNDAWFRSVTEEEFVRLKRQELKAVDINQGWFSLLGKKQQERKRVLRMRLLKYAGIFILPVLALTMYFFMHEEQSTVPTSVAQEILPGVRKAILQMADGSSVLLHARQVDTFKEKDGTLIDLNGESIVYESNDTSGVQVAIYNTLTVPRGGEYVLTLSDGTAVHLNADSKLRFPVKFVGDKRVVKLEGEGYFHVVRNENSPFIVEVSGMEVTVLGTEFNIFGYDESGEVRTTLINGSVKISSEKNERVCVLSPGEQAVFNKENGQIEVSEVDVSYAIAWKDGLIRFRDRPLKEIMGFISRWYDVEVVYKDEDVKDYLFGCNFDRHATVLPLLELFQSTGTVHFEIVGKKIIVSK